MIVKRKTFFAWNMDKEKQWLEEQAKQGYVLKDIKPFRYYFEKEESQDLVYEFDFQILSKENEKTYLDLFEDWNLIGRVGGWYYFCKEKGDTQSNTIYNDNKSRKALFTRLIGFIAITGFPLYYQVIILFPNMDPSRFEFPNFYFFARIVVLGFLILHMYASIRIFMMIKQYSKRIQE